jgi:hypothetical protein
MTADFGWATTILIVLLVPSAILLMTMSATRF